METLQIESPENRAKTTPLDAQKKSQNEINGQKSADIAATLSHVQSPPERIEEKRSSLDETKTEKEPQASTKGEGHVVEKAENDEAMKTPGEKEKRSREEGEEQAEEGPEAKRVKKAEEEVPGRGVCLADIPNFVANYSLIKPSSTSLRKLYKALFKTAGKPQTRREEILQWRGISPDASTQELFDALNLACTSPDLMEIGKKYLGLPSGSGGKTTKRAWCEAVAEILADPQPEKVELAAATDSSKRLSSKGAGGYQAWCRDNKDALKAKHPDLSPKEFRHIQSEAWKTIPDDEREKYLGPATAKRPSPKRKGKPRKSKYEEDDDEPVGEEHEDEEEAQEEEVGHDTNMAAAAEENTAEAIA